MQYPPPPNSIIGDHGFKPNLAMHLDYISSVTLNNKGLSPITSVPIKLQKYVFFEGKIRIYLLKYNGYNANFLCQVKAVSFLALFDFEHGLELVRVWMYV